MLSQAPFFLALRYLKPRRSFVSVITLVSILGVAVGVLMMIVVRAVMVGFEADFRDTLMGTKPHVLLRQDAGQGPGPDWQAALSQVKGQPGVLSATPFAGDMLYVAQGDLLTRAQTLGIPPDGAPSHLRKERLTEDLRKHWRHGVADLSVLRAPRP